MENLFGVKSPDVVAFDQAWMTAAAKEGSLSGVREDFTNQFLPGYWKWGEAMEAMVRMYDLTHDREYLNHLRDLSRVVLDYRDDHRTDRPGVQDPFRGQVMPAWGGRGVNYGYLHHAGVVLAGVYAYPIAAFARIVAEDSALHEAYGADALEFANATLETVQAFSPELENRTDDSSTYVQPRAYATLLTESTCKQAYDEARGGLGPDGWAANNDSRLSGLQRNCNKLASVGRLSALAQREPRPRDGHDRGVSRSGQPVPSATRYRERPC